MQYAFLLQADVGEKRLHDQPKEFLCVRQGVGTAVLCYPLSVFLSFTFLKLFLYTQSVVRILYLVYILPSVCSFQSSFYTYSVFYTQSTVCILYRPILLWVGWVICKCCRANALRVTLGMASDIIVHKVGLNKQIITWNKLFNSKAFSKHDSVICHALACTKSMWHL